MKKLVAGQVCRYCGAPITKKRALERIGRRINFWATLGGDFYCPRAGGECWHEPRTNATLQETKP